ncbi:Short-chain dehydrogenase/reductase SDR [Penicillium robsamsonii]|uniref:Short-chain dehydrogenase/reductase SDR n=1 Tax=Penicillium robsamsonii TaxID=1792511 RepID=UPI002548CD46|nr:Short-chain dehydrogenase/reductase SDR [Penicillium robsamsonii]KAJ5811054.1 Short-chain dehydrogenase/reductase SDR [Penicillium robsamsonii]
MASMALPPSTASPLQAFVRAQFLTKPAPPPLSTCLAGQTAIVTGANTGIGLAAAASLLRYHASHIVIASRSVEKGEAAASPLRKQYPDAQIEVWQLDMLSYESIQGFVKNCSNLSRLDKVILNAGVAMGDFVINKTTGHEATFQVNYLSTALLAILLLPILKSKRQAHAPGRMTIVASGLGLVSQFANRDANPLIPSFDDPKGWGTTAALERYGLTKTLVLMLVQKLSEIVDPSEIIINAIEPGLVGGSGLQQHAPAYLRAIFRLVHAIAARSIEQGAWAYVDAVAVKDQESHGGLVLNWKIHPFHPMMYEPSGKQATERLWKETMQELGFSNAQGIIDSMHKAH